MPQAFKVSKVQQVRLELTVIKEAQVLLDNKAFRAQLEQQALQVLLDYKVPVD